MAYEIGALPFCSAVDGKPARSDSAAAEPRRGWQRGGAFVWVDRVEQDHRVERDVAAAAVKQRSGAGKEGATLESRRDAGVPERDSGAAHAIAAGGSDDASRGGLCAGDAPGPSTAAVIIGASGRSELASVGVKQHGCGHRRSSGR